MKNSRRYLGLDWEISKKSQIADCSNYYIDLSNKSQAEDKPTKKYFCGFNFLI